MEHTTKIGIMGTGLDAYWPQFKGLKETLMGHLELVEKSLLDIGECEVVSAGLVDTVEKSVEAGHLFREKDITLLFLYVTTYSLSSTVLPAVQRAGVPVIILNAQPSKSIDYNRINNMGNRTEMTGYWLEYCSACPVPEFCNVFKRCGIEFHQVNGVLEGDALFWDEVRGWARAAVLKEKLFHNKTGLMGHYYSGMLDIYTDLTKLSAVFGGSYQIIEVDELSALREAAVGADEIDAKVKAFHQEFVIDENCDRQSLIEAARTSLALDGLVEKYGLGAMAYYYMGAEGNANFEAVSSIILGNSLLTGGGVPMAGEFEIKNVLAMKIMDCLGVGGSFTEYYAVDYDADVILMGHDGPGHIKIAEGKPRVRPLEVYHGKVGKGLSIEMSVKHGPATLLSVIDNPDSKPAFLIAEGESVDGPILEIGNTNSRYRFSCGCRSFMEQWNSFGPAHHCAIGVGHVRDDLQKLASLIGIEAHIVI